MSQLPLEVRANRFTLPRPRRPRSVHQPSSDHPIRRLSSGLGWGYESRCVEQGGAVEPVPEKALERFRSGGLMVKLSMDMLIEALFQAVLSEENKPLSVRHRRVKDRILEAEAP